jgi:hypothetical protein
VEGKTKVLSLRIEGLMLGVASMIYTVKRPMAERNLYPDYIQ